MNKRTILIGSICSCFLFLMMPVIPTIEITSVGTEINKVVEDEIVFESPTGPIKDWICDWIDIFAHLCSLWSVNKPPIAEFIALAMAYAIWSFGFAIGCVWINMNDYSRAEFIPSFYSK